MKHNKFYRCEKWNSYVSKVKQKLANKCSKCNADGSKVRLTVYHSKCSDNERLPYELSLELCDLLCSKCKPKKKKAEQPKNNWVLINCIDLEQIEGNCERQKDNGTPCNKSIRYLFYSYHASYGYAIFGSTCIDYMTEEDQVLALSVLDIYQRSRKFILDTMWSKEFTKSGKIFMQCRVHGMGIISMFDNYGKYSYALATSVKNSKGKIFHKPVRTTLTDFNKVALLAYLHLLALKSKSDVNVLRNMYKTIHRSYSEILASGGEITYQ